MCKMNTLRFIFFCSRSLYKFIIDVEISLDVLLTGLIILQKFYYTAMIRKTLNVTVKIMRPRDCYCIYNGLE